MKRFALFILFASVVLFRAEAQRAFSEDQNVFFSQVMQKLNGMGTEPARKVAFDFGNAWRGNFTQVHKDKIQQIALDMDKKGLPFDPYFWYYFSYLAFSVSQAHLNSTDINEILDINAAVYGKVPLDEYGNFLLGVNMFMARRIVAKTRNVYNVTDLGTFKFKLLEDYVAPKEEYNEYLEQEDVVEEQVVNSNWDDSAKDPWSNSDPWSNNNSNDQSSYEDSWVDQNDVWGFDVEGKVYEEKQGRQIYAVNKQDYVAGRKALYRHPIVEGPAIQLENNSMLIVTPYDSIKIKETDGTVLLKSRMYAGENAVINWPLDHKKARGAVVNLGQFYIRTDRADFWSPNAKLTFPEMISKPVEGVFTYKSIKRKVNTPTKYPIFTSFYSDLDVKLPDPNVSYHGGIEISGNEFAGTSVSRRRGRLVILDGKGNEAVLRSVRFDFRSDSTIYAADASLTIKHGKDSLYHPSVELYYYASRRELVVLRTKQYETSPFSSTFFKMNVNAEIIKWNMKSDSINFSIMQGKDLVPVTIESEDYFNKPRYSRLSSGYRFHPISTSVYYARMYNTREFADQELADHFKLNIKEVKGAMKILQIYGFGDYNSETGLVQLNDKAFRYYDASGDKIDYDYIFIPSIEPNRPNATWRLDSADMIVTGVKRMYLTSDYKVYAEPDSGIVKIQQGRNIELNGMVNAGDFQYRGKNYLFDYDQFLINMSKIDSIRISVHKPDSLQKQGEDMNSLNNHLTETSGTLYLNNPYNKSGVKNVGAFPDFVSESDAIVYFDGPEVLNGAYDRSVKFIIPPFDVDSLSSDDAISFEGTFNSGGVFPNFQETLRLQEDKSLGFVHKIPAEGYNLYGTAAKTYETIRLSNQGMRGRGKIDFITSTILSDDFVYYPDSVAAYGKGGVIRPGSANGASYPEAVLGPYRMHWEPRIDSMYLKNLYKPFKFYNATAQLTGAVNITSQGVKGSGTMLTRGSKAVSKEMNFREFSYGARHANFEILTDNPKKPAVRGKDIRLNFDLKNSTALINPEKAGVAALEFPYAQMRTSITNAVWDLEDSTVTMTKPANVPIKDSYFYTTRKELDSLAFNAEQATYDFNTKELFVSGIPFIKVADARIIPDKHQTTILENFELQAFNNAIIIVDTVNQYHYLYNGEIKIISRNEFQGSALYRLVTGSDTFAIRFDHFDLNDVFVPELKKSKKMTVSNGQVVAKENLIIAPGYYFKGDVKMYAYTPNLELNGSVKLMMKDESYDYWVNYHRSQDSTAIEVPWITPTFDDETEAIAGMHYDLRGNLYSTFVEKRKFESDEDFFMAKGVLTYDQKIKEYRIEPIAKTEGESYQGQTMIYNDSTKNVTIEGLVNFFNPYTEAVKIKSSVMGYGNRINNDYNLDAFMSLDFINAAPFMELMSKDLLDIIERLGPPLANEVSSALLYKFANMSSDKTAKAFEKASLKDYKPLMTMDPSLVKSIVISGVKLKWSPEYRAFYNTTKLAISNIMEKDINAKLDGFIELRKDETNNDILNLFIQAAPGTWYYIGFSANNLIMYSSNSAFNDAVQAKSNFGTAKAGDLTLVLGEENEVLKFINDFRSNYFGITEPYDLVSPDEVNLEDETFDTIKQNDDDSFGF